MSVVVARPMAAKPMPTLIGAIIIAALAAPANDLQVRAGDEGGGRTVVVADGGHNWIGGNGP